MELGSDFLFQLRLRFETGDIALQEDLQNCLDGLYEIGQQALVTPPDSGTRLAIWPHGSCQRTIFLFRMMVS